MKYLVPTLLMVIVFACENQPITDKACDCEGFYHTSRNTDHPLLEFRHAYKGEELGMFLNDIFLDTILLFDDSSITFSRDAFFNTLRLNINESNRYENSPQIGYAQAADTAKIMEVLSMGQQLFWSIANPIEFVWSKETVTFKGEEDPHHILYALHAESSDNKAIRISDISSAQISQNLYDNSFNVSIAMTDQGTEKWRQYTQENVSNYIAILSFNEVLSAPIINGPITGGETLVSFDYTKKEAEQFI